MYRKSDNSNPGNMLLPQLFEQPREYISDTGYQVIAYSTRKTYLLIRYKDDCLHYFFTCATCPESRNYKGYFNKDSLAEKLQVLKSYIHSKLLQVPMLESSEFDEFLDKALEDFDCSFQEWVSNDNISDEPNSEESIVEYEDEYEDYFDDEYYPPEQVIIEDDFNNAQDYYDEVDEIEEDNEDDDDDCLSELVLGLIFFAILIGMLVAIAWACCFIFSTLMSTLYN